MSRLKYYPPELQRRILDEAESEGNMAAVARRYGVDRTTLIRWRAKEQQGTLGIVSTPISPAEVERMAKEVAQLKKMLGEKELEIAILKDLVKKTTQRLPTKSR